MVLIICVRAVGVELHVPVHSTPFTTSNEGRGEEKEKKQEQQYKKK